MALFERSTDYLLALNLTQSGSLVVFLALEYWRVRRCHRAAIAIRVRVLFSDKTLL